MPQQFIKFISKSKMYSTVADKDVYRYGGQQGVLGDVARSITFHVNNACYSLMFNAAQNASWDIARMDIKSDFGFHSVTGNLLESIGIAVVGVNPRKNHLSVTQFAPSGSRKMRTDTSVFKAKRKGLKKGEVYGVNPQLPDYADGTGVPFGKAYRGETDYGAGTFGRDQRMEYIQSLRSTPMSSNVKTYTLYAFAAMPYASKVNVKKGGQNNFFQTRIMPKVVQGLHDAILQYKWEKEAKENGWI